MVHPNDKVSNPDSSSIDQINTGPESEYSKGNMTIKL
jgi:hypothetical protein